MSSTWTWTSHECCNSTLSTHVCATTCLHLPFAYLLSTHKLKNCGFGSTLHKYGNEHISQINATHTHIHTHTDIQKHDHIWLHEWHGILWHGVLWNRQELQQRRRRIWAAHEHGHHIGIAKAHCPRTSAQPPDCTYHLPICYPTTNIRIPALD